ncbi:NUDIX hydrolase [Candidatus Poribacteria bacterium]|jgi:8-oxo-dGTP diphosphatase|nr:NUDIX hydrolase [Candidatus Poribacteria bacterium]MBT5535865.1 NUDIX hydrolase [Candidatus Poribacteria bacterium]MBT5711960.1 NUDIX hydrolase [Candidatus Poribacteria bacterium]MBT7096502.1 NUDIX hydrolase [Candidatus Poribacteria bacterium]MBT7806409.1 NUDIX hydrolase [Candidatus Poribacteria bacterium]
MPTIGAFAAIFDDERRILLVRRAYGPKNWTNPGGRMDPGESIIEAVEREAFEETGHRVAAGELVGIYSSPFKDDMVVFFEAGILNREAWSPNSEIAEVRFFSRAELPPLHYRQAARFDDAFEGRRGVVRVFDTEEPPE